MQARVSVVDTIEEQPPGGIVRFRDVMSVFKLSRKQSYALARSLGVKLIRCAGVREIRVSVADARQMERALRGEVQTPQAPRAPIRRRSRGH